MALDKKEYCCIGECNDYGEKAHLVSRKTLPRSVWEESTLYVWLCRRHHNESHSSGIVSFCHKYNLTKELCNAKDFVAGL